MACEQWHRRSWMRPYMVPSDLFKIPQTHMNSSTPYLSITRSLSTSLSLHLSFALCLSPSPSFHPFGNVENICVGFL